MPYSPRRRAILDRRRRWALGALAWIGALVLLPALFGIAGWLIALVVFIVGALIVSAGGSLGHDPLGKFISASFGTVQIGIVFSLAGIFLTLMLYITELGLLTSGTVPDVVRDRFVPRDYPGMGNLGIVCLVVTFACAFSAGGLKLVMSAFHEATKTPRPFRNRLRIPFARYATIVARLAGTVAMYAFLYSIAAMLVPSLMPSVPASVPVLVGLAALLLCAACWLCWILVCPRIWWMSLRMVLALAKIR